MSNIDIEWDWDEDTGDDAWSVPPFTITYAFKADTNLFDVYVYSDYNGPYAWWNVKAENVHPKDKEAVGESLLALCEQRYAQENPNG
jgi:hypothetical protein